MNTPAHATLNLLLIARRERDAVPVAIGAVLPDTPMMAFYAVEKLLRRTPEPLIWGERYFDPLWQGAFDLFNSIPSLLVGLALVWFAGRSRWLLGLLGSMLLHSLLDLPLHAEDAHRHFWPFSEWRFASPVSYWDPSRFGVWVFLFEAVVVFGGTAWLLRRYGRPLPRLLVLATAALYAVFVVYAVAVWGG